MRNSFVEVMIFLDDVDKLKDRQKEECPKGVLRGLLFAGYRFFSGLILNQTRRRLFQIILMLDVGIKVDVLS